MDEINAMNAMNVMNETDEMNETNEVNEMNEMHEMHVSQSVCPAPTRLVGGELPSGCTSGGPKHIDLPRRTTSTKD